MKNLIKWFIKNVYYGKNYFETMEKIKNNLIYFKEQEELKLSQTKKYTDRWYVSKELIFTIEDKIHKYQKILTRWR